MPEYTGPLWVVDHDSTLIELGDVVVDAPPERLSRRTGVVVRVVAVVLLCLVSLGASVRVPPGLSTPLWTGKLSLAGFALGSTFLAGAEPGSRVVVGRDPFTGDPRWETQVDDPPQINRSIGDNFAAVITKEPASPDQTDVRQNITVILSPTGAVVARVPGDQVYQAAIGGYFLVFMGQPVQCPADAGRCFDVAGFDARTGAPAWRLALPGLFISRPDGEATRFLTGGEGGLISLRDVATGAVLESYQIPGGLQVAIVVGETLVTADRGPEGAVVTAYRPGPFHRLWSVTVPAADTVIDSTAQFYLRDCGRLVCLHVDGGNAVLDLETGAMRAYVGLDVVDEVGAVLLAVPTFEQAATARDRRVLHVLSAADGRELSVLPDTVQVRWAGSGGRALLARAAPGGVTGFIILGPDGQLRRLGGVPGADLSCQARDQVLACVDPIGALRVWRLPD